MDRSARLLLIISSLEIMLVSFNNDNNRSQSGFGTVGQAGCHPKASGFEELGIRLKNQLWQIKKALINSELYSWVSLSDAVMIFDMFH